MLNTQPAVSSSASEKTALIKQVFDEVTGWNGKTPVREPEKFEAAVGKLKGAGFRGCAFSALEVACQIG